MAEQHPEDVELFDYVEDDLAPARRTEVGAHLATCEVCTEQVRRVEAGREALRNAQFMHLPERRGEAVFMNLPTQAREPGRLRALSPKQLLAVLTPIIAIAAVVGVLVSSGTGSNEPSGEAAAGATAGAAAGGAGSPEDAQVRQAPLLELAGTPSQIAGELRDKGFDATVRSKQVVVHGATKNEVREALADHGPGDVEIVVEPVKNP